MSLKLQSEPNREQSTEGSVPRDKVPSHRHSVRLGVIHLSAPLRGALDYMLLSSESDNCNHGPLGASSLTCTALV